MNKKIPFLILLNYSIFFGFSQDITFSTKNSLMQNYSKGIELQNNENWYDATQYFFDVVNENPAFSDAWFRLSTCLYETGDYDLALKYIEQAEKYEKTNPQIQNLKGMILLALDKIEDAQNVFNQIIKSYPNDVSSHFGLAEIELLNGKNISALFQYEEALKRNPNNRKALLSMAIIYAEQNNKKMTNQYLTKVVRLYSGEPKVNYFAAIIYSMQGDYKNAEKYIKYSLELKNDYIPSYELLGSILYMQNRFEEVINICEYLISQNRQNASAWYLMGMSQLKLNQTENAIQTWITGLSINPQDEIMRTIMENQIRNEFDISDYRRKEVALFHLKNALQCETQYDKSGSSYEYQRALLLDPLNFNARLSYAKILESDGMYELFLDQLNFIQENSETKLSTEIQDSIEAYSSLLENNLTKKWKIDSFFLDKIRWNIGIYYTNENPSLLHVDSQKIAALSASDVFSGIAITCVKTQSNPVESFGQAFNDARKKKYDYFIMTDFRESLDDVSLTATMYSAKTGTQVFTQKYYATGNNKFSTVLRRFRNSVLEKLTVKGKVLNRNGKIVLIDLGLSENIKKDYEFKIIKKGMLQISDDGIGLKYKDDDVVGMLKVTNSGEEISEAEITSHGFYDKINIDDEIVLINIPQNEKASTAIDNVPNSTENGQNIINNEVNATDNSKNGNELVLEIKKSVQKSPILDLLRTIN